MNEASTSRTAKTRGWGAETSLAFVFVLAVLAVPFAVFIALALAGLAYRASHPEWRRRMAPQFVRVRARDR
jgi:hypothetical protein